MQGNKSPVVPKILLVVCGTLLALIAGELILRAFNVDLHLLRKILYYQCAMPQLHRTSPDAQRLFELIPNSSVRGESADPNFKDIKYPNNRFDVSINALGFRGKNFTPIKKPGVFRIVVFGGSNTFGMNVSDEDTYPAQMQKIFDEKYPGKVEVWNAGISAYVMSQDVAYAETVIKKFDPDLLILQDTNRSRRAFYGDVTVRELRELFSKNNELFMENMPFLGQPEVPVTEKARFFLLPAWSKIHDSLVRASALYRTIYVSVYVFQCMLSHHPIDQTESIHAFWGSQHGQKVSDRELNLFTGRHKDKKIILFFTTDFYSESDQNGVVMRDNMGDFILNTKDKSLEYRKLHPPSYVYTWYARELCNFLVQKGYIPADGLNRKETSAL